MRRFAILPLLCLTILAPAYAKVWSVGPTRTYTRPSAVSTRVGDGDTVDIDAGVYESDVARWSANNLVLRGTGGMAHMKANGNAYGSKAIWVIAGNNTRVDSIEFSLCTVPDNNGAGIRQEGVGLMVMSCSFHDNEDGILAGDNPTSDIYIQGCTFYHNGHGDGLSHNLYINHVRTLTFIFNYSYGAVVGHELKSRAYTNYILYNRLANEATGTASREIDLPNGGTAFIVGNEIQQGPHGENSNIIGYGLEGLSNPTPHRIIVANNTIVNDRGAGSFLAVQNGTALCGLANNIFAGPGTLLSGVPTAIDSASNLITPIANAGLVDAAGFDYHLAPGSPAIDAGSGIASDTLTPVFEFGRFTGWSTRKIRGRIDIGAHESTTAASVPASGMSAAAMTIAPNPSNGSARITLATAAPGCELRLGNALGQIVAIERFDGSGAVMVSDLPAGIYHATLVRDGRPLAVRTLIVVR